MANQTRPIEFLEYLPKVYRTGEAGGDSFTGRFLRAFEALFEQLEAEIEGTPGGDLSLKVRAVAGALVTVEPFDSRPVAFPADTPVTVAGRVLRTRLAAPVAADLRGLTQIKLQDASVVAALKTGDVLRVHAGGIPDLFHPDTTPPAEFAHRPLADYQYLKYLASWLAQPLRDEKPFDLNRAFFDLAVRLGARRGTPAAMEAMLRAWLRGDLLRNRKGVRPMLLLTDLTTTYNIDLARIPDDAGAVFQLAPAAATDYRPNETYAQVGLTTSLGEGPPFFFIADLVADPTVRELHSPAGLDVLQRAARALLDAEKPAHTYYQLRVRATTMQLAPKHLPEVKPGRRLRRIYAQLEDPDPANPLSGTAMLWDGPWVFDSDC